MVEKLLVVEDEKLFGEAVKALFGQEIRKGALDVVCAYDGEEALNLVKADTNHEIEVILLDLKMPAGKMDGFTFLKTLHEQNIYIKTIIITAYATPEHFRLAVREQVLFFFAKPLQRLYNLKEVVEEALAIPSQFDKNTQKVRFNTLTKVIGELSSSRQEELIYKITENLEVDEIKNLQNNYNAFLENQLGLALKRQKKLEKEEKARDFLIQRLRSGEIEINAQTPPELLKGHYIEKRFVHRKNGVIHGPYYYLRWRDENNKLRCRFLTQTEVEEAPIEIK